MSQLDLSILENEVRKLKITEEMKKRECAQIQDGVQDTWDKLVNLRSHISLFKSAIEEVRLEEAAYYAQSSSGDNDTSELTSDMASRLGSLHALREKVRLKEGLKNKIALMEEQLIVLRKKLSDQVAELSRSASSTSSYTSSTSSSTSTAIQQRNNTLNEHRVEDSMSARTALLLTSRKLEEHENDYLQSVAELEMVELEISEVLKWNDEMGDSSADGLGLGLGLGDEHGGVNPARVGGVNASNEWFDTSRVIGGNGHGSVPATPSRGNSSSSHHGGPHSPMRGGTSTGGGGGYCPISLHEILSGQAHITRINGEEPTKYRVRLEKRLSALLSMDQQLTKELDAKNSDLNKVRSVLKDIEIQRLRKELELSHVQKKVEEKAEMKEKMKQQEKLRLAAAASASASATEGDGTVTPTKSGMPSEIKQPNPAPLTSIFQLEDGEEDDAAVAGNESYMNNTSYSSDYDDSSAHGAAEVGGSSSAHVASMQAAKNLQMAASLLQRDLLPAPPVTPFGAGKDAAQSTETGKEDSKEGESAAAAGGGDKEVESVLSRLERLAKNLEDSSELTTGHKELLNTVARQQSDLDALRHAQTNLMQMLDNPSAERKAMLVPAATDQAAESSSDGASGSARHRRHHHMPNRKSQPKSTSSSSSGSGSGSGSGSARNSLGDSSGDKGLDDAMSRINISSSSSGSDSDSPGTASSRRSPSAASASKESAKGSPGGKGSRESSPPSRKSHESPESGGFLRPQAIVTSPTIAGKSSNSSALTSESTVSSAMDSTDILQQQHVDSNTATILGYDQQYLALVRKITTAREKMTEAQAKEYISPLTNTSVDPISRKSTAYVEVGVMNARELPITKKFSNSADPFVELFLVDNGSGSGDAEGVNPISYGENGDALIFNNQSYSTGVKHTHLNPQWRETFKFVELLPEIDGSPSSAVTAGSKSLGLSDSNGSSRVDRIPVLSNLSLFLLLMDHNKSTAQSDIVGECSVPLSNFLDQEKHTIWISVKPPAMECRSRPKLPPNCGLKLEIRVVYNRFIMWQRRLDDATLKLKRFVSDFQEQVARDRIEEEERRRRKLAAEAEAIRRSQEYGSDSAPVSGSSSPRQRRVPPPPPSAAKLAATGTAYNPVVRSSSSSGPKRTTNLKRIMELAASGRDSIRNKSSSSSSSSNGAPSGSKGSSSGNAAKKQKPSQSQPVPVPPKPAPAPAPAPATPAAASISAQASAAPGEKKAPPVYRIGGIGGGAARSFSSRLSIGTAVPPLRAADGGLSSSGGSDAGAGAGAEETTSAAAAPMLGSSQSSTLSSSMGSTDGSSAQGGQGQGQGYAQLSYHSRQRSDSSGGDSVTWEENTPDLTIFKRSGPAIYLRDSKEAAAAASSSTHRSRSNSPAGSPSASSSTGGGSSGNGGAPNSANRRASLSRQMSPAAGEFTAPKMPNVSPKKPPRSPAQKASSGNTDLSLTPSPAVAPAPSKTPTPPVQLAEDDYESF